jgi:glycosyltransferase involved in cell wall biosynthesis
MKTSLIVTTYNRPDALGRILEALENQTRLPDELIIADDGSGPETSEKIATFSSDPPYMISHVWQEDRGFRAARIRNKAIRKATGEYIILLDGDCVPHRSFVEDHLILAEDGFFIQGKRVLVSKRLSPDFSYKDANSMLKLFRFLLSGDISNVHHLVRLPIFPAFSSKRLSGIKSCNMGFFKKDIVAVNGFNQDFEGWGREDSELAVRLYHYGLQRKEHLFLAICFHLWHEEHDRTQLITNDQLLNKTMQSKEHFCSNGLVQKRENQSQ